MKKYFLAYVFFIFVIVTGIYGCGKVNRYEVPILDVNNNNQSSVLFDEILKSDTGYYYRNTSSMYEYHYYDNQTGKNVYLCNRPECLHDNDEFCTATNSNYLVCGNTLYDGKIYMTAYDLSDENEKKFVLLRLEPDGSNLTLIAELKESTSNNWSYMVTGQMIIHRGICMASYGFGFDDTAHCGTIIYNLNTGEKTELTEYSFGKDFYGNYDAQPRKRFIGNNHYIYFNEVRPEDKKRLTFLCRYNIESGEIEEVPRPNGYKGNYNVNENDLVVFFDEYGNGFTYDWTGNGTKKYEKLEKWKEIPSDDGTLTRIRVPLSGTQSDLIYYNHQFIVLYGLSINDYFTIANDPILDFYKAIAILDEQMQVKELIDGNYIAEEIKKEENHSYIRAQMSILDDELYIQTEKAVYKMPMQDVLESKGKLVKVFDKQEAGELYGSNIGNQ